MDQITDAATQNTDMTKSHGFTSSFSPHLLVVTHKPVYPRHQQMTEAEVTEKGDQSFAHAHTQYARNAHTETGRLKTLVPCCVGNLMLCVAGPAGIKTTHKRAADTKKLTAFTIEEQ